MATNPAPDSLYEGTVADAVQHSFSRYFEPLVAVWRSPLRWTALVLLGASVVGVAFALAQQDRATAEQSQIVNRLDSTEKRLDKQSGATLDREITAIKERVATLGHANQAVRDDLGTQIATLEKALKADRLALKAAQVEVANLKENVHRLTSIKSPTIESYLEARVEFPLFGETEVNVALPKYRLTRTLKLDREMRWYLAGKPTSPLKHKGSADVLFTLRDGVAVRADLAVARIE